MSDLKKVMNKQDMMAKKMKDCLIRAAVYASRGGKNGFAFRGPDGYIYPDSSKAFVTHSGMKPCARCKGNKQGVRVDAIYLISEPWTIVTLFLIFYSNNFLFLRLITVA